MSRKSTLGDALAAHPSVDMLAPAIPIIIWAISGRPVPDDNVSQNLFVALSTLSGLVMAAVTFICSMSYQSESRYMQIARDRYHDELSRNWVSIIAWTAITAVLPLASLCAFDVVLDPAARRVTRSGTPLHLTPREFDLLEVLLRNRGIVLYREVLYERVWGLDAEYDSRTLDLHIQRLRKKLGWKNEIRTVFRVGYVLERGE